MIFFFSYISCALGGDKITREYIVKVNGIEVNRGSVENLLNRIIGIGEDKIAHVVDMNTDKNVDVTTLTIVKEGTNIKIDNSELVKKVINLFEKCSKGRIVSGENIKMLASYGSEKCVFQEDSKIQLCINANNQITKITFN